MSYLHSRSYLHWRNHYNPQLPCGRWTVFDSHPVVVGVDAGATEGVCHHVGLWHPQGWRHFHSAAVQHDAVQRPSWAPRERWRTWHRLHAVHRQTHNSRGRHQYQGAPPGVSRWRQCTGVWCHLLVALASAAELLLPGFPISGDGSKVSPVKRSVSDGACKYFVAVPELPKGNIK